MPDMWEALDEYAAGLDDDSGSGPAGDEAAEADKDEGFLGSKLTIEEVAARGGPLAGIAKELVEIKREREERQAKERAALEAEAAIDAGRDFDDPAVQAQLLALVEQRRAETNRLFEAETRKALRARGLSEEAIEDAMVEELAMNRAAEEAMGPPSLFELPEYRTHMAAKAERERARSAAIELRQRMAGPGWEVELENANAEIHAALEAAISA